MTLANGSQARRTVKTLQMTQKSHRFLQTHRLAPTLTPRLLHRNMPLQSRHGCWVVQDTGCSFRLPPCTCSSTSHLKLPSGATSLHMHTSQGWVRSSLLHISALVCFVSIPFVNFFLTIMWMSCDSVLGRLLSGTRALGHHLHQTLSTNDVLLWRDFRNTCHGRTCHFQDSLSILFTPFSPHLFTSAHLPSSQTECVGDVDWRRRFWVLHWSSVGITVGVHG